MLKFGQWVRCTREEKRMTQTECAIRAGMKIQQWNNMERATRQPELQTVNNVANALEVDVSVACAAAGYPPPEKLPEMRLARRLERYLSRITDAQQRERIEQMLEADAEKYVELVTAA